MSDSNQRRDRVLHALSDSSRRHLLHGIAAGLGSVAEISDSLTMTGPAVSKHLRVLEKCGLIERCRKGRFHRFVLQPEPIAEAVETLSELLQPSKSVMEPIADEFDVALL
jgi:DNA-binding transcriptional ArsR family regulator